MEKAMKSLRPIQAIRVSGICLLILFAASTVNAAKRNVVLLVVDDQGTTDAGCYGNRVIRTPGIDRLAAEGTRFTHAFCTTASCSASRSVILTGLQNHANGQYGHQHSYHHFRTKQSVRSLPVLMKLGGYRTARIGKYHVGPPEVYAFDEALPGNARNAVQMAENSRNFIRADEDRPFFLYFCTSDPHRGGGRATELTHGPDRFGNRPGGYPGVETVRYRPEDVIVPPYLPDSAECRAELAQYYQSVSRIDQGVRKLIGVLEEAGVYDDTLIIYISDNGIAFPGAKTTLYDPGMRLPCIVRSPYQERKGVVSGVMITWADLAPTILDFAGALPPDQEFHGRSFLGVLERESAPGWDEVYASHTFHEITMYYPMRVVRTRHHKLIWNIAHPLPYPFASDLWESPTWQAVLRRGEKVYGKRAVDAYLQRPKFELYDLRTDPHEVVNLAADPQHAATLKELQRKLRAFQKRTRDPWILKWDYE